LSLAASATPDPPAPEPAGDPDEGERALLDFLIEQAWHDVLRKLRRDPTNDNG
jgi:hypothetical protein